MRLLIADDHGIVRGGLKVLLEQQPDMTVVAEAEDGQQALEMALAHRPDLCVLDVSMPKLTGLQVAREIRAHLPDVAVLMLSMHDDDSYLFEALKAGAGGYVLKREADQFLVSHIQFHLIADHRFNLMRHCEAITGKQPAVDANVAMMQQAGLQLIRKLIVIIGIMLRFICHRKDFRRRLGIVLVARAHVRQQPD